MTVDVEEKLDEDCEGSVSDLISMDSKSLAVGFPSGVIKLFNRKNLTHEKVQLFSMILISDYVNPFYQIPFRI